MALRLGGVWEAVAAPRIDCSEREMLVDSRLEPRVVSALEAKGHRLKVVEETFATDQFAAPLAILVDPETDRLHGGACLFGEAIAMGY